MERLAPTTCPLTMETDDSETPANESPNTTTDADSQPTNRWHKNVKVCRYDFHPQRLVCAQGRVPQTSWVGGAGPAKLLLDRG